MMIRVSPLPISILHVSRNVRLCQRGALLKYPGAVVLDVVQGSARSFPRFLLIAFGFEFLFQ